ncbi:MAG: hypothetical protein N3G22_03430 [Candidatus Micrarchaeota archaeon]|nr:hypothetical protein [Candidatus Micrarchaeota archaeon]
MADKKKAAGEDSAFGRLLVFLERLQGAERRAKEILNSVYQKMPTLPFLGKSNSAVLIASISIYLIFFIFAWVFSPPFQVYSTIKESPLAKNSPLKIAPGETYVYELSTPLSTEQITYQVSRSSNCSGTFVSGGTPAEPVSLCLSSSGNLVGDTAASNLSFGALSVLFFAPWMLAASDNFSWQVTSEIAAPSANVSFTSNFTSLGRTKKAGREVFEIMVQTDYLPPLMYYVDAEKRVLISGKFENSTVKAVSAPFSLNWTESG